jgi:hypothetical protein
MNYDSHPTHLRLCTNVHYSIKQITIDESNVNHFRSENRKTFIQLKAKTASHSLLNRCSFHRHQTTEPPESPSEQRSPAPNRSRPTGPPSDKENRDKENRDKENRDKENRVKTYVFSISQYRSCSGSAQTRGPSSSQWT